MGTIGFYYILFDWLTDSNHKDPDSKRCSFLRSNLALQIWSIQPTFFHFFLIKVYLSHSFTAPKCILCALCNVPYCNFLYWEFLKLSRNIWLTQFSSEGISNANFFPLHTELETSLSSGLRKPSSVDQESWNFKFLKQTTVRFLV